LPQFQQPLPNDLSALLCLVRGLAASGRGWHGAIDALRPFTQDIWQRLPRGDRRRFLRHLRPWWEIHRHRMPPAVATRIEAARASGQLQVHAGRIAEAVTSRRGLDVHIGRRGGGELILRTARVVNCCGPCSDVTRSGNPLIRVLLRDGLARPDACRLGLDTTADGALRGRDGSASQRLFAIGPLTRGTFWEITAIPDIRRQSEDLALHLSTLLQQRGPVVSARPAVYAFS
jgi:uncharacterized NAD(P)/FAD-binding protein YdhS